MLHMLRLYCDGGGGKGAGGVRFQILTKTLLVYKVNLHLAVLRFYLFCAALSLANHFCPSVANCNANYNA